MNHHKFKLARNLYSGWINTQTLCLDCFTALSKFLTACVKFLTACVKSLTAWANRLLPPLHSSLRDESGSAVVEFVALAIPLFIPIFIYLNSFASLSGNEAVIRTLAREGVRAYVASDNDYAGRVVSQQAVQLIAKHLGLSEKELQTLSATYECSRLPCLSANSRIRLTISYVDSQTQRRVQASAQENISPWK
ncbi:unannotated protein [freshwater metagenome]|uniref:Unannotated protein n=1 Tax=freshwater metagenome TaxID=449393 RepID=A0A6J7T7T0_9ZZZZ